MDTYAAALAHHRRGDVRAAEALYEQALAESAGHHEALRGLGILLCQQGRVAEGATRLRACLSIDPDSAAVRLDVARACQALGEHAEALDHFERALELDPAQARVWNERGVSLAALGSNDLALESFRHAAELAPDSAEAHYYLGRTRYALREYAAALSDLQRSLVLQPLQPPCLALKADILEALGRHAEALADRTLLGTLQEETAHAASARGISLAELERLPEALEAFELALRLEPEHPDALNNCGIVLARLNRHAEAVTSFERLLAKHPDIAEAWNNRGASLTALGQHAEAMHSYERALALRPDFPDALVNKANALAESGADAEPLALYQRVLQQKPASVDALVHAGQLLTRMRRLPEALELLERGLTLDACYPYAAGSLFDAAAAVCHWPLRERAGQAAVEGVHAGRRASVPFTFVGISDSPADQLACARVWVQQQIPTAVPQAEARLVGLAAAGGAQGATARTRIAYLSPDLRDHPVGRLVAPVFESHDRAHFEITAVRFGPRVEDPVRARIERAVDQVLDVSDLSDRDAAVAIRASGAAVAVDLAGYTRHARTGILAHRAAPVQASWLGYPGTLGADFIDYLIADASVCPDEHGSFYTESIVRLPHSVLAAERHAIAPPPTRDACALPREAFVFCNVGSCYKLAPQIFAVWMRMLLKSPQAVLWLSEPPADAVANLRAEARSCGVAPERLIFAPRLTGTGQYLARLQLADLFLDTLPYGSHSTAADALWAGLPLLTCEGATFAGRVGASLLRNVALPELITTSLAQYESLGIALAADRARLERLRQRLEHNRRTAPLFDPPRLARDLGRAYRIMWDRYRRGGAPETFDVSAM